MTYNLPFRFTTLQSLCLSFADFMDLKTFIINNLIMKLNDSKNLSIKENVLQSLSEKIHIKTDTKEN